MMWPRKKGINITPKGGLPCYIYASRVSVHLWMLLHKIFGATEEMNLQFYGLVCILQFLPISRPFEPRHEQQNFIVRFCEA